MLKFKFFFLLLILGVFFPAPSVFANSVGDLYNTVRRQMMKNEELALYLKHKKEGSPDLKAAVNNPLYFFISQLDKDWVKDSDDEIIPLLEQYTLIEDTLGEPISILYHKQLKDEAKERKLVPQITSTKKKMHSWEKTDTLRSMAIPHIDCLTGVSDFCKDKITQIDYKPLLVKSLADIKTKTTSKETKKTAEFQVLGHLFSRPMEDVEDIHGNIHSKPLLGTGEHIDYSTNTCTKKGVCTDPLGWKAIYDWFSNTATANISSTSELNTSAVTRTLGSHLAKAQGYGISLAARRAAEDMDQYGQGSLLALLGKEHNDKDAAEEIRNEYEDPTIIPRTIREDIHMLLAIDAQIIHQLGHINAVQSAITELVAGNYLGAVKTYGGTSLYTPSASGN